MVVLVGGNGVGFLEEEEKEDALPAQLEAAGNEEASV